MFKSLEILENNNGFPAGFNDRLGRTAPLYIRKFNFGQNNTYSSVFVRATNMQEIGTQGQNIRYVIICDSSGNRIASLPVPCSDSIIFKVSDISNTYFSAKDEDGLINDDPDNPDAGSITFETVRYASGE